MRIMWLIGFASVSCSVFGASSMNSLSVTVTVVRSAPVTTTTREAVEVLSSTAARVQPRTAVSVLGNVEHVTITY
jgi:hypothetical protein